MVQRWNAGSPALWAFGLLVAAGLTAAGCAGTAGSRTAVLPPGPAAVQPETGGSKTLAYVHLLIPKAAPERRGRYVSPNTKYVTAVVQGITASPWPAPLPTQLLTVATPSPCASTTKGVACSFTIKAYAGHDQFTFATFASGGVHTAPLAIYKSPALKVVAGTTIAFVLEGVVNAVALEVPSPLANTNAQLVPVAAATSFPLGIVPYDASGAAILESDFAAPVTLSVSPKGAGVTLSLVSSCGGGHPSGAFTLKLACAEDLTHVRVAYDGSVPRKNGAAIPSVTISASPQAGSPQQPAVVAFRSGMQALAPQAGFGTYYSPYLTLAPSGLMYFASGGIGNGVFGSFDPKNPSATMKTASVNFSPSGIAVDGFGDVWLSGQGRLDCFTSVTSTPAATAAAAGYAGGVVRSGGAIWYQVQNNYSSALTVSAGFVKPGAGCTGVPATAVPTVQLGNTKLNPIASADAGSFGISGSGIWAATNVGATPFDGLLFEPNESSTGTIAAKVDFGPYLGVEGLTSDGLFDLYASELGSSPAANRFVEIPAGSTVPQTLFTLEPNNEIYMASAYSPGGGAASRVAVIDGGYGMHQGVDVIELSGGNATPAFLPFDGGRDCFGVGTDAAGGVWAGCVSSSSAMRIYTPVYEPYWGLSGGTYMVSNLAGGYPSHNAIGIIEKPGTDSSPFTVIANTNPSAVAVASTWSGFSHDIPIDILSGGSSTLTIRDKNGLTQKITVQSNIVAYMTKPRDPRFRRAP